MRTRYLDIKNICIYNIYRHARHTHTFISLLAQDWFRACTTAFLFIRASAKEKHKYNIEEYTANDSEKMKAMPLGAAIGSLFFFYNLGIELSKHTILYSSNQVEMEIIQEQLISEQNGDGTHQFLASLEEMLENLKISLN